MAIAKHGTDYITSPLTRDEIEDMQNGETGMTKANVAIDLDIIFAGYATFEEVICEAVIGSHCLDEIDFRAIDVVDDNMIVFEVTGWVDEYDLNNRF